LGKIVFHNPQKLRQLNDIVHPEVFREIKKQIQALSAGDENALVVINVPLLIEVGWHDWVDVVILVTLSAEIQLKRLMKRNGLSPEEAHARISCQMDIKEKEKYADYIIDNSSTRENTRSQTIKILKEISQNLNYS
jgi:dephospho-CoA kinase